MSQSAAAAYNRAAQTGTTNRELEAIGERIAQARSMTFQPATPGGAVSGTFRETLRLSSGRFAMIDDGLGFQLVNERGARAGSFR